MIRFGWFSRAPAKGRVDFGDLRRARPVSRRFGYDRGRPVDRAYIERFLEQHAGLIRGRVLEVADSQYTRRYGGDRVRASDVLHARPGSRNATIVGDLCSGQGIPVDAFDCVILTQVLQFTYDCRAAVATLRRIVAPGGAVLATFPGISQISRYDMDRWGEFWRFTSLSARRLFEEAFGEGNVTVSVYGNPLAAAALLYGLAAEELTEAELRAEDPDYEVLIAVSAMRPEA